MSKIEPRHYRDTLGQFCTGVVIVTGANGGEPAGFAAQSFTSLSLDPPLVAVCPSRTSTSWPRVRESGAFCINVLGDDQKPICDLFARTGIDKFGALRWHAAPSGSPVLDGVLAYIDCSLEAEHDAGDHTIAIGRVVDLDIRDRTSLPLLFFRGLYGRFHGFDNPV